MSPSMDEPFDYIVFGATGDLTMRKLLPALYYRYAAGQVVEGSRIIGTARSKLDSGQFRKRAEAAIRKHVASTHLDGEALGRFLDIIHYAPLNGAEADSSWPNLRALLGDGESRPADGAVRVFYLATAPNLYGAIAENLAQQGLIGERSRIVLEKPIGTSLATAQAINEAVGRHFPEESIFRIDHYLGKETVQNIIALRFANPMIERLWDCESIEYVQITAAETVGVEGRGDYYDGSGALRDMIQNHLLQILCIVAMERPASLDADVLRDGKLKVLEALKPVDTQTLDKTVARGQYVAGNSGGEIVPAYGDELSSPTVSLTETFVALKVEIDNTRWQGVPFYLRSGKRLPKKVSEVVVQFRRRTDDLFGSTSDAGRLVIRIQPNESVSLPLSMKHPGVAGFKVGNVEVSSDLEDAFGVRYPDSYEGLMLDAVRGYPALFVRKDETETAWRWVTPILESWAQSNAAPEAYAAGSWGPSSAHDLLSRNGHVWLEDAA